MFYRRNPEFVDHIEIWIISIYLSINDQIEINDMYVIMISMDLLSWIYYVLESTTFQIYYLHESFRILEHLEFWDSWIFKSSSYSISISDTLIFESEI